MIIKLTDQDGGLGDLVLIKFERVSRFPIESQMKVLFVKKISQKIYNLSIFCWVCARKSYSGTLWKTF
jgi:hypothetical protein